jgi:SAM-dependent methyltransferase
MGPLPPSADDRRFGASVAELYESHLVPLIFEPYARDIARRLAGEPLARVLEVAAGTGVVARELARTLPDDVAIVATDLNPAMLERAAAVGTVRPVEWRQADAMALPFGDAEFDALACQFGAMFFPDAGTAFAEARRVLRPGSLFLFNVWDRLEDNEFADVVTTTVAAMFPDDPPLFLRRTPHGHHDAAAWLRVLADAGFSGAVAETVAARSVADSAARVAVAYCQGTPLRNELEARAPGRLQEVTAACTRALATRFGAGRVDGKIQALVFSARA